MKEERNNINYHPNPRIDFLFGYFGEMFVPTNQGDFKPLYNATAALPNGEQILENLYIKKPDTKTKIEFRNYMHKLLENFDPTKRIEKPYEVEVLISISVNKKRYKSVDVDNLSKTVLDSIKNIVFEDDSQVSSLIVKKFIHGMNVNSLLVGVTKLTEARKGFADNLKLFSSEPWK